MAPISARRPLLPAGALPSKYDSRDLLFDSSAATASPSRHWLKHPVGIRDQRSLPCCVSIALTTCLEILDAADGRVAELAPLFHYYHARPEPERIAPIEPRTAFQVAANVGICIRALHDVPHDPAGAVAQPSPEACHDARAHRLVAYDPRTYTTQYELLVPPRVQAARQALAAGNPVFVAFWMTSAYDAILPDAATHGMPGDEALEHGHAVVLIGYDDDLGALLVEDSRGSAFASGGRWHMPYDLFESALVYEAWAIRRITYNT